MEALLRTQLESVSDRTLGEWQQAVWSELQVSISLAQVWRALRKDRALGEYPRRQKEAPQGSRYADCGR
jgi:hypothetical protein